jgi:hypothetical protein
MNTIYFILLEDPTKMQNMNNANGSTVVKLTVDFDKNIDHDQIILKMFNFQASQPQA